MLTSSAEPLTLGNGWAPGAAKQRKQASTGRSGRHRPVQTRPFPAQPSLLQLLLGNARPSVAGWADGWSMTAPQPSQGDCHMAEGTMQLSYTLTQACADLNSVLGKRTQVLGKGPPKSTQRAVHRGQGLRPEPAPPS